MLRDSRYEAEAWVRSHATAGDRIGYFGAAVKLPHLEREIATVSMPGQLLQGTAPKTGQEPPKFVMVIPIQSFEIDHESTLPAETYAALRSGSKGYRQVAEIQTASLFSTRPIAFVNPPVRIFARKEDAATYFAVLADPAADARQATLDGLRIRYRSHGHGGHNLVLIHGWGCDQAFWRDQVSALSRTNRIITLDLPGHGASDKPHIAYTLNLLARAVNAVLVDAGIESAVLVGHSMGVTVAHQFYQSYPEKTEAIIAVDGSFLRSYDSPEETRRSVAALRDRIASLRGPHYWRSALNEISAMYAPNTPIAFAPRFVCAS
jgi:hypothetical protein